MQHQFTQPPPLYYYDHFIEMLDFVQHVHKDFLNEDENKFLHDFRHLAVQSQCLYIRMYNMTKPIFHLNHLFYDEIGTCDAVEELIEHGYLRPIIATDYESLLSAITKLKLIELSKFHKLNTVKSSWKKSDVVNYFQAHLSFSDFISLLSDVHYYIPLRCDHILRFKKWWRPAFDKGIYETEDRYNPEQTYVVIDVETTGMRTPTGRVTEIGAVKIQNGQIIGEWTSLINPDSYIPPFITNITGISNEMVKDAPFFHEIAEEFEIFMGDAVFVAHNVNFDYGFISAELKRVGKHLDKIKLCTVASMRQYYPGRSSYSLASICKEYGISLTTHHRALCDAQAAAQLLLLINEKRFELSSAKEAA